MTSTVNTLRRSPLYRQLAKQLSEKAEVGIKLSDLTHCSRIGFKGADTVAWLESLNVAIPERPNQTCELDDGFLNARLSDTEFFLIDRRDAKVEESESSTIELLRDAWSMDIPERTYLLERGDSHSCFEITSDRASEMFAKICGIDLRPSEFENLSLAQTSVGKLNAIVIRVDKGSKLNYLLLADLSAAEYLWAVVEDAIAEFNC